MPGMSRPGVGAVLFVVVLGHVALFPKVADLDGFYHLGHAFAYAEGSMFDTSLPWATQSVIADRGADLWWGFHVGLMPFTVVGDVAWGIRLAALVLTLALATSFFWILSRHEVAWAAWWTAVFLIAVPNVFFRHLMLRPHLLSLSAGLVLLSLLVRGSWRPVFLASAFITWTHLSLFWLGPGIVLAYLLVRLGEAALGAPTGRSSLRPGQALSAVFLGTVAGWLLRPHPLEAGLLANVQIIRLFAQRATEAPLLFAGELLPLPFMEMVHTSWLFLAAWLMVCIGALSYLGRNRLRGVPAEERTLLLTTLLISVTFMALALVSARRAMEQWVAFGFLALPLFWTHVVYVYHRRSVRQLVAALLLVHVGWGGYRHVLNVDLVAFRPDTMTGPAEFLEAYSQPGELVFHARWDNFGPLFAQNRTNLYLGGMDPIFQFAHEPRLYWEYFYLSADINVEWTCDAFPCPSGVATDTYEVLRDHFGARWVVVEPDRNPRLSLYLLNDPRYALALETQHEAVFEVLEPVSGEGPSPESPAEPPESADVDGAARPDTAVSAPPPVG